MMDDGEVGGGGSRGGGCCCYCCYIATLTLALARPTSKIDASLCPRELARDRELKPALAFDSLECARLLERCAALLSRKSELEPLLPPVKATSSDP